MASMVLISSRPKEAFAALSSLLQAKNISLHFLPFYDGAEVDPLLWDAEFVLLDATIGRASLFGFLDFAAQRKIRSIPVVCFDGTLDQQLTLECAARFNHFIFDTQNESIVGKKLSNLLSLITLRNERNRLKEVEKNLEQESEKLVEVNVNNVQLIGEVNRQNKLLDLAKRDIQNLLDNLEQGFFTLGRDGIIQTGYSKAVLRIFETPDPAGHSFTNLLRLDEPAAEQMKDWINLAFGDVLPFKDLAELGQRTFSLNGSHVELDYRLIRNETNAVEKLIVIATDKTIEKALERKVKAEENHARMVLAVVRDRGAFADFVGEARIMLKRLAEVVRNMSANTDATEPFRLAHTLKGNSAAFGFEDVRNRAHELESKIAELRENGGDMTGLLPACDGLSAAFEKTLAEVQSDLGDVAGEASREKAISVADIHFFKEKLQARCQRNDDLVKSYFDIFIHGSLEMILQRYDSIVRGIAARMSKEAGLEIVAKPIKMHVDPYKPLLQSLIHIFRNALDHGIEPPDEREAIGKPRSGKLLIAIDHADESQDSLRICVSDDGRGIDAEAIKSVAVGKGLLSKQKLDSMPREQLMNLLFLSSFSTKAEVSEWSGRGVGLDAVANEAANLGGAVSIDSELGKGTCIEIVVPVVVAYS